MWSKCRQTAALKVLHTCMGWVFPALNRSFPERSRPLSWHSSNARWSPSSHDTFLSWWGEAFRKMWSLFSAAKSMSAMLKGLSNNEITTNWSLWCGENVEREWYLILFNCHQRAVWAEPATLTAAQRENCMGWHRKQCWLHSKVSYWLAL